MATRERYLRGWARATGFEVHVALEHREGDDERRVRAQLRRVARGALGRYRGDHDKVCRYIEVWMDVLHPGRPFFVETDKNNEGMQVFQPYDRPVALTSPERMSTGKP